MYLGVKSVKNIYKICIFIVIFGSILNIFLIYNKTRVADSPKAEPQAASNSNQNIIRPIAYVINNIPEAMPQSGLYGADYVYEVLAEGGITRLIAIYIKSIPERIGPIRSARHNFLDISMEYDAVFAHFGGSPRAFSDITALGIPNLNGIQLDGKMYFRDNKRKAPHNAYTNTSKTLEYIKKLSYDKQVIDRHFLFNKEDINLGNNNALSVHIPYSYSHYIDYIYDNSTKLYNRNYRGKPNIDEAIGKNLTAKNIIIQFAKNTKIDDENRQEIYLIGSGKGYYVTNGSYINITWVKQKRDQKTIFYNENNQEIKLNQGQTWIQVVPIESKIVIK